MGTANALSDILSYSLILIVSLVLAEIFKRKRQSEALAYLTSGIILGPSVLNLIHPSEILAFISEIGAMILLFTAGLETDIEMIRKSSKKGITLAISGAFFSFILAFIFVYVLTNDSIFAFFLGATSVATSVGITIKIFADFNKLKSKEAQIILIAAVIDDIIGVIFLTLVISLITAETITILLILEILFRIVSFFIMMFILNLLISKYVLMYIEKLRASGARHIFAFSFALLSGYIAGHYGLSPIIGAYMAGLILGNSYVREEVVKDVSAVAFVTVPVFFALIGLKVQLIMEPLAIILGLFFTVLAILGKILGGFLIERKIRKKELRTSLILGVGMMPRGEVGFIFLNIGDALGLLDPYWYFATILMIIATTFLTPIIIKALLEKEGE